MISKLFTEEAKFDPSQRAEGILDHVLDETSEITLEKKANAVSVEEALHHTNLIKEKSDRVLSRVLFVTNNPLVLDKDSSEQTRFIDLADLFDEIHIMHIGLTKRNTDTVRLAKNVWVYPTVGKSFLTLPLRAYRVARRQLQFTDGFRPDLVVALDPFESGLSGYFIAKKFKRAFQVQVTTDFYTDTFSHASKNNKWRLRFARYVLNRTKSVRVNTDILRKKITTHHRKIKDLTLLPHYFNIHQIMSSTASNKITDIYPQFSFVILFVGRLDQESTLFRAIDATRRLLQTPSIGMVVIGDGPTKSEFQQRAKLLGIESQIMFTPKVDDIVPHMRSANVLMCTDTSTASEEVVITAAAAGLPIIMAKTPLREDLFTDSADSFLCEPNDTQEFSEKLVKFVNTNALRTQFSQNAKEVVTNRIEEDPQLYKQSLRDSIESVLYLEEELQKVSSKTQVIPPKNTKNKNDSNTTENTAVK